MLLFFFSLFLGEITRDENDTWQPDLLFVFVIVVHTVLNWCW